MPNIRKAGDLLSEIFRDQFDPVDLKNGRIAAGLLTSWESTAIKAKIPNASDHSRIRDFDKGVVLIEAEHPGWVQLLQTKQNIILAIFQEKFPELGIQGVSFCLSRTPIATAAPGTPAVPAATEKSDADVAESLSGNKDSPEKKLIYDVMKEFEKAVKKRNKNNTDSKLS